MNLFIQYWPRTYLKVGVIAFAISVIGMPILIFLLRRLGVIDHVKEDKLHEQPVPRGGGILIAGAYAAAVLLPGYYSYEMKGIMIGGFLCLVLGAIDDFRGGVPAVLKVVTLLAVTLILSHYGVRLKVFQYAPLDVLLTLLWIVGVVSAFNGIDNMDGLAGGSALIVSAMYLTIALQVHIALGTESALFSWFGLLAAALIGSNLGFLVFNFKPAKIFMGDSGSFFLGFTLAALGVMGEWNDNRIIACFIPLLILGVPLFDFAYIIIARIVKGHTRDLRSVIEHCAMDHLSHRLTWIGFSQRQAVLFIYLLCVILGVSGILLRNTSSLLDGALAISQGLAIFFVVVILMAIAERRHAKPRWHEGEAPAEGPAGKPAEEPGAHRRASNGDDEDGETGK